MRSVNGSFVCSKQLSLNCSKLFCHLDSMQPQLVSGAGWNMRCEKKTGIFWFNIQQKVLVIGWLTPYVFSVHDYAPFRYCLRMDRLKVRSRRCQGGRRNRTTRDPLRQGALFHAGEMFRHLREFWDKPFWSTHALALWAEQLVRFGVGVLMSLLYHILRL